MPSRVLQLSDAHGHLSAVRKCVPSSFQLREVVQSPWSVIGLTARSVGAGPPFRSSGVEWSQFERLVGEAFRRQGYDVAETDTGGGDGSVDLVVEKDNSRFLVQCKQWRTQRVGVTTIRELNGVRNCRPQSSGRIRVTCGDFTHEAQRFAQECGIELVNGDALASLIRAVGHQRNENVALPTKAELRPASLEVPPLDDQCPKCG